MTSFLELPALLIPIDSRLAEPLYRQVYRGIREAILSGRVPPGVRLPSTRRLSTDLDVSRSTVLLAFDQLVAEGYIIGAVGSGSYVARQIPDHLSRAWPEARTTPPLPGVAPRLATRGVRLKGILRPRQFYPQAFWSGVPPVDEFPLALWSSLATRCYRDLSVSQLYHGPAAGHRPLREAIAEYLTAARGMRCTPDQVIVLSSAQEALELSCRALVDPGDGAWLEDPSWPGVHGAMVAAAARVVHVPVDTDGLVVEEGMARAPDARLVYVSPSHQYPAGVTMNLERRLALLDWAARNDAWILEDDYDSEFRYTGRPLTALHGLDTAGRVLYIGTFNKTLFPSLRVGYLVAPENLVRDLVSLRSLGGQHAATVDQAILAAFISEGHFARHLRRLRTVGRERRDALLDAAARHLPGVLDIPRVETGLHAIGWLPPEMDDVQVSARAAEHGIEAAPLSAYYVNRCPRGGLVLGYGGLRPQEIDAGMRRLAQAISTGATSG